MLRCVESKIFTGDIEELSASIFGVKSPVDFEIKALCTEITIQAALFKIPEDLNLDLCLICDFTGLSITWALWGRVLG
jgi:hypothetical protein